MVLRRCTIALLWGWIPICVLPLTDACTFLIHLSWNKDPCVEKVALHRSISSTHGYNNQDSPATKICCPIISKLAIRNTIIDMDMCDREASVTSKAYLHENYLNTCSAIKNNNTGWVDIRWNCAMEAAFCSNIIVIDIRASFFSRCSDRKSGLEQAGLPEQHVFTRNAECSWTCSWWLYQHLYRNRRGNKSVLGSPVETTTSTHSRSDCHSRLYNPRGRQKYVSIYSSWLKTVSG